MIRILKGDAVSKLDQMHCKRSGQSSYELMETAVLGFIHWFEEQKFTGQEIFIYVGGGNNGGDGLGIARHLQQRNYQVTVVLCFNDEVDISADAKINFDRLPEGVSKVSFEDFDFPSKGIFIDAFLGVGLKGKLRDSARPIVDSWNKQRGLKIAIDIPSGLLSEGVVNDKSLVACADYTVTFAFPKLSLLFPENAQVVGELVLVDIGIADSLYQEFESDIFYTQKKDIPERHKRFHRFSHKGDFGRILLIGGSLGKMGAVVLSAKSALRTGAGLVTCQIDESERFIIQASVPEAMVIGEDFKDLDAFDSIGVGPGWGVDNREKQLEFLLKSFSKPMVLDADALNVLSRNPELMSLLPKNSILTPHLGEFERLVGSCINHPDRMKKASKLAKKYQIILVLKGANTLISLPDGRQLFNSTGTHFMATGGSGDVLTGMITAFLGMGYSPENAAICGVFHHGLAGEYAGKIRFQGTIASDIIEQIPRTFEFVENS